MNSTPEEQTGYTQAHPLRVFSHGGGWQSVAAVVLQAQGLLTPYDMFVFASVGYDAEPATHDYHNNVLMPYAAAHGITIVNTFKTLRGKQHTLTDALFSDNRSVQIPAYMENGAPGNRTCTTDWKIRTVDKYVRGIAGGGYVEIGLGFSMDEQERCRPEREAWSDVEPGKAVRKRRLGFWKRNTYPLLREVERPLFREDIPAIIASAGLPMPPKSACSFCPFLSRNRWIAQRRDDPEAWALSLRVEAQINAKRELLGKDKIYLHADRKPLEQAVGEQDVLFDFETGGGCESGTCFT